MPSSGSQPGDHTQQITSSMFTPISGVTQHLDLSDEEAAALIKDLADITGNDRYPFSRRIQALRAILAKLRPEPVREPAPPAKAYRRNCHEKAPRRPVARSIRKTFVIMAYPSEAPAWPSYQIGPHVFALRRGERQLCEARICARRPGLRTSSALPPSSRGRYCQSSALTRALRSRGGTNLAGLVRSNGSAFASIAFSVRMRSGNG